MNHFDFMNYVRLSSHLKADGSGWSRETSRTLISLLSEQTLLTSGTRLSICTLHEEVTSLPPFSSQEDIRKSTRQNTYRRTGLTHGSLRTGWPWRTLKQNERKAKRSSSDDYWLIFITKTTCIFINTPWEN